MPDRSSTLVSRFGLEVAFALVTMAFGATVIWGALEFSIGWGEIGPEAGYFPFRIGSLIVLASLVNLVLAVRRRNAEAGAVVTGEGGRRLFAFGLPIVVFVGVAMVIGIYVASALYLLFTVGLVARHRLPVTIGVSLGFPLVLFVLFEIAFRTPLLKGPVEAVFGWY
jgi:hypothetical protein